MGFGSGYVPGTNVYNPVCQPDVTSFGRFFFFLPEIRSMLIETYMLALAK